MLQVNVIEMEADRHDKLVGLSSHFPFLMASLLVDLVNQLPKEEQILFKSVIGPGFKDTTRVAGSSPEWAVSVCKENSAHLSDLLRVFETHFDQLKEKISQVDEDQLDTFFTEVRNLRQFLV
jgi:prephenate dehydrogenase